MSVHRRGRSSDRDFDHLLFQNAAAAGAECLDDTRVVQVDFAGDRADGVQLRTADGSSQKVAARVVVDATGQRSLIATQLGLREVIPELRKAAIWTYFRDAERLPGEHGGATLVMHTESKDSWFWYIPLAENITSVGVVSDVDRILRGSGTPEEAFGRERGQCPALQRRLQGAERTDDYHVAKEFSYTTTRHAGDGWVLVGDAFGFIDPIYSSGVFFALRTGEMAADCIADGLREDDVSAARLGRWTDAFKSGARWVRQLVDTFYSNSFSFGKFARDYPGHRGHVTDILIGRVFDRDMSDVFAAMCESAGHVEANQSSENYHSTQSMS